MKRLLLLAALVPAMPGAKAQNVARNCYRGFVDLGYSVGIGDYKFNRFEISTSQGYQFNPYIFLGAGVGFHFMPYYEFTIWNTPHEVRDRVIDIPLFANLHLNFTKTRVTPFVDAKGGVFVTNNGGAYANASGGIRVAVNDKQAVSLSVGYTYEELQFEVYHDLANGWGSIRRPWKAPAEAVTVKLGYEF